MNKILIITHTGDNFSIEKVTEYIGKNGCEVIRFDVDLYPLKNKLSTRFEDGNWMTILETPEKNTGWMIFQRFGTEGPTIWQTG
uniref:MvdC/MvdD family ATP grasp protein n=1 Tax=Chryseobacterium endophyticum TaxID=1854762 RepID=A0AAU6WNF1_9FLAO